MTLPAPSVKAPTTTDTEAGGLDEPAIWTYPPGFVAPTAGPGSVGTFVPPLMVADPVSAVMVMVEAFAQSTMNGAVPSTGFGLPGLGSPFSSPKS